MHNVLAHALRLHQKHKPISKRKRHDITKKEKHLKPKQTLITMYGKRKGEEELEEEEEREEMPEVFVGKKFREFRISEISELQKWPKL